MPITTAFRPPAGFPRTSVLTNWGALLAAAVAPLVVGGLVQDAPHVPRVVITNSTDQQLAISASTPSDATRSLVTIIDAGETQDAFDIIDRGATWVLHFRAGGCEARPVEVSRSDLIGTLYAIPEDVGQDFADNVQPGACR